MDRPDFQNVFKDTTGAVKKFIDLRGIGASGFFGLYADTAGIVNFSYKIGPSKDKCVTPDDPLTTGADGSIGASVAGVPSYIPFLVPVGMWLEIIADGDVNEAILMYTLG